ncbi:Glycerophosphoryl diester phosphodiesterase [Celeribacter indicus]|uniref:Glycerophosphoryl diester phosphodiesterase n=2 Tax=Celeribacter indicus TaxID=1208324 RepID=A0A0B5DQ65_9RHOB|nr:glycerophosphoryl diester phosphodiesterase [Celeribacter indicus]SDX21003.1 Glycerophosphoryl diester phosphodiesterase [Celeribacter indicus]
MPALPEPFLARPIAHRALHDGNVTRAENNLRAIDAAIAGRYGIEIDLQLSQDGVAMVFHDYALDRLTDARGPIAQRDAAALGALRFGTGEVGIPTLSEVLARVDGRAPLLIELKDQDGAMGPKIGALEAATARALDGYGGPVALMSFNPHSVVRLADLCPGIPRGLTTGGWADEDDWPVPAARRAELREIPDYARTGAAFISHQWTDLGRPRVGELKAQGAHILCWTVRSPEAERTARAVADNITFEGYRPA